MFPEQKRVIYKKNPIFEVVAQLRYPSYLPIATELPARFQSVVWDRFPYIEVGRALNVHVDINGGHETTRQVKNVYDFFTEDRLAKLTLTDEFVALSFKQYTRWEHFSELLKLAVTALVTTYKIRFFTRIGLRYIDLIDRVDLNVTDTPWRELIRPSLLGVMSEDAPNGILVQNVATNFQISGPDYQCAFNCGMPNLDIIEDSRKSRAQNGDIFVLDTDFFTLGGNTDARNSLETLSRFNRYTRNAFRWAIQPPIHHALGPNEME